VTDAVESQITVVDAPAEPVAITDVPFLGVGGKFIVFTVVLGLIAGVAAFAIRLPYLALEPGRTFETEDFIAVEGAESFTSPGEVSFVTVTQRRLTPFNWAISKLQDSDDIFHEDELLQGRTIDEQREENAQLMLSSQNSAIAAALGHLGFTTTEPAGVVVVDVVEGGPVDGLLERNDLITEVDGLPVVVFDDLYDYLGTQIDTSIDLVVQRPGSERRIVTVDLTRDTRAFLGVVAADDPTGTDRGAYLGEIIEGEAVEGFLEPGDRIVSLDGAPVTSFDDLVPALGPFRAGDVAMIEAIRTGSDGTEETIAEDVVLGVRVLERAGLLNIATQLRDAELPFEVGFTTEDIGGPSAGLAFTITVLDVLTEGDLTGGAKIVVTGTIDREGNVGAIGGVKQKAFAAKDAGAEVFIVPDRNLGDAVAAVEGLRIESVMTLSEALDIIADFGGNADELPTNGELS
jgi:PDZ domain-containing secreted protein